MVEDRRQAFIDQHTEDWVEQGLKWFTWREAEGITLTALASWSQFSRSKLKAFEDGQPLTHRKAVDAAYRNFIQWNRVCIAVGDIGDYPVHR